MTETNNLVSNYFYSKQWYMIIFYDNFVFVRFKKFQKKKKARE